MQKQVNNSAPISNAIIFKRTVIVLVFILSTFVILSVAFILLAFGMGGGTGGVARGAVITSTLFAGLMLFLLFRTCRKQWRINPTKTSRVPFYIWFMAAAVIVLFLLIMIRSVTGSYFGLGGFF